MIRIEKRERRRQRGSKWEHTHTQGVIQYARTHARTQKKKLPTQQRLQLQLLENSYLAAGVVQVEDGRQGVEAGGVKLVGVGHDQVAERCEVLGLHSISLNF